MAMIDRSEGSVHESGFHTGQRHLSHLRRAGAVFAWARSVAGLRLTLRLVQVAGLVISTGGGAVLAYGLTLVPDFFFTFVLASALIMGGGWLLFARAEAWLSPEIAFDPTGREFRLSHRFAAGAETVLLRRSFDSLAGVRLMPHRLQVLDQEGAVLVDVPIADRATRANLHKQLVGHLRILS